MPHHHHFDDHIHSLYHDPGDEFYGTDHDHDGWHHHHGNDAILHHKHDTPNGVKHKHVHFDYYNFNHLPTRVNFGPADHTHNPTDTPQDRPDGSQVGGTGWAVVDGRRVVDGPGGSVGAWKRGEVYPFEEV